ncbi:MAG: hypothetical protein M1826_005387 [Phylliscum demangeonii]|nr:MAG: hypothetical protein M1826_005387 [Phylliscum demangeonii]
MHFPALILIGAAAVLAAPLPDGGTTTAARLVAREEPYTIDHPHPDVERLWKILVSRRNGHRLYMECMQEEWEYEKCKRCIKYALENTHDAWSHPIKIGSELAHGDVRTVKPAATEPGAADAHMPFRKETQRLAGQLFHLQHSLGNDMRRLHFAKPVKVTPTAAAEEKLRLRAFRSGEF